ncbi:hypothetical protein F4604DRAFT_1937641 [Suillus subluteus]|nr:hypothetical protein F4604DRAFT_1937641 [Suillus subluteus]
MCYIFLSACTKWVLELFLILTWSSKVSGYEFYTSLEQLTNNTGLNVPKSRYKEFMRMVRQFRHIKLMKQAGRGNIMGGIYETEPGALAIKCPACPQPGMNLPEDWDKVEGSMKFIYYLIIAMDANFRLKNRNRSFSTADPGLHTGLAYFVPEKPYVKHILKNTSQADGVGDLQKGERYANMDFIFFSSIVPLLLLSVVISYDITCQWKLNLMKRMNELPEHLQILAAVALAAFIFGIPKFHCPAHEEKCAIPHSLNLMPGVGRTDGEGIEHNWAEMNQVANRLSLWRKLLNAIKECGRQQSFLCDFNSAIDDACQGEWTAMIEAWECDKSSPNPYILSRISLSEAQIRVNLVDNEKIAISNGHQLPHEMTPSSFINMGLVLEDAQQRIKFDLASSLSANQGSVMIHLIGSAGNYIPNPISSNTAISIKINAAAAKYRVTWSALLELVGISELGREFQCLEAKDIVAPIDTVLGVRSTTGIHGRTRSERDTSRGLGQGYQMTSWIWFASGIQDDETDAGLDDMLRVEWAKSRARAQWWNEEVLLLKEEMQRTQQFLAWHAQQWQSVTELSHQDAQIVAGALAYAHRQEAIQRALLARFTVLWGTGVDTNNTAGEDELIKYFAEDEENFDDDEG